MAYDSAVKSLCRGIAAAAALLSIACGVVGYGPAVDRSRFISVAENERGLVLFTAQEVAYRPAAGMNAFPDGGIPRYVKDRNLVGIVDGSRGRPAILHVKENRDWQHGQGELHINGFVGNKAVITESGQRRSDYLSEVRYYLLDVSKSALVELSLGRDMQSRGRNVGYFYLLDGSGTLLLVTPPAGSMQVDTATNEIWLRKPAGTYALVAKGGDLYMRSAQELVYWEIDSRTLHSYDVATGARRRLDKYVPPPQGQPSTGVGISSDGKSIERSQRGDTWRREKTLLTLDAVAGGR